MHKLIRIVIMTIAVLCMTVSVALAGMVAIINGASSTTEWNTTADITNNLVALEAAIGNTTTVLDAVPASLAGYAQVWDLRFFNSAALTAAEQNQYLSFLQGGGSMFVMGENYNFIVRNNSVLSLIALAGGGNLSYTEVTNSQTVNSPFTGPNAVTEVHYAAPGGFDGAGSGSFITQYSPTIGSGIAFGPGDLANAPLGTLTTIFDVNFMQNSYDIPNSQNLLKNLVGYVDNPTGVPEPATMLLLGLGLAGIAGLRKKIN